MREIKRNISRGVMKATAIFLFSISVSLSPLLYSAIWGPDSPILPSWVKDNHNDLFLICMLAYLILVLSVKNIQK
jgi:hypothetical protein